MAPMTIKVEETMVDIRFLYTNSQTDAQRGLAGYIIKSGQTNNPILGGSFLVLRRIEKAISNNKIYFLYPLCEREYEEKILHIAQLALDGKFDNVALTEREKANTMKFLNQPL